jgi:hypothetical protein
MSRKHRNTPDAVDLHEITISDAIVIVDEELESWQKRYRSYGKGNCKDPQISGRTLRSSRVPALYDYYRSWQALTEWYQPLASCHLKAPDKARMALGLVSQGEDSSEGLHLLNCLSGICK